MSPDWFVWVRLALYFDVGYVAEPAAYYRIHKASEWQTYQAEGRPELLEHPQRMRWRLLELARESGDERKVASTVAAIVRYYVMWRTGQLGSPNQAAATRTMSGEDFERSLSAACPDGELRRHIRRRVRRGVADDFSSLGNRCYAAGDVTGARRLYGQALRENPAKPRTLLKWVALSFGVKW
jgi:hypothetical protein